MRVCVLQEITKFKASTTVDSQKLKTCLQALKTCAQKTPLPDFLLTASPLETAVPPRLFANMQEIYIPFALTAYTSADIQSYLKFTELLLNLLCLYMYCLYASNINVGGPKTVFWITVFMYFEQQQKDSKPRQQPQPYVLTGLLCPGGRETTSPTTCTTDSRGKDSSWDTQSALWSGSSTWVRP